jgi:hypothetical protein
VDKDWNLLRGVFSVRPCWVLLRSYRPAWLLCLLSYSRSELPTWFQCFFTHLAQIWVRFAMKYGVIPSLISPS